jgi:tripartite ATP-independent transporter DctP family solute receptor
MIVVNLKTPRGINRRGMLSLSLGAAIAPGLIARPAIAQTKATVLRFGGSQPLTTNYGQGMVKLGEELARRSEGRLTVQVFPSGQLGGLKDMVTAVQLGTQSMVMVTPTWIANYAKQLDILSLLYFSRSQDKLFEALDGPFGTKLATFAEPVGFKILGWWNSGPRHILNNVRPINTPDDVKGLKLRSQTSPIWLQSLRALGANPVSLDYPEIYLALQQGTIDGYENPAPDVVGGKFYEVVKYMSLTSHLFDIFLVAINKRQWDRLSPADKQAMEESMAVATKWQREAEAGEVKQALDLLRTKMKVNDISDADRQLFAERVRPGYQDFAKLVGEDFFAEASRALS